ncbi:YesK-like family protein [Bacillus thuringiensis]
MDWLDGFGIFYIIGGITIILVFAISYLLKKRFPDKQFDIIFALSLILLCLASFPVTMIVIGGWVGRNGIWIYWFLRPTWYTYRYDCASTCENYAEKLRIKLQKMKRIYKNKKISYCLKKEFVL